MAPTTKELRDTIREVLKEEISDKLDKLVAKVDELAGLKSQVSKLKKLTIKQFLIWKKNHGYSY